MSFEKQIPAFEGSDGGYFPCEHKSNFEIGYTDGVQYFPTSQKNIAKQLLIPKEKILGMSYGYMANRGEYRSPKGIESQSKMYNLGLNWVCLSIANYQKTFYSTSIHADYLKTPTDRDIEAFVRLAHNKNVKVCLKPMLNSEDNMWRAHIGFPDLNMDDMDIYWEKWFKSYTQFILHYAELANELNCEMLCIGCEMLGTEHRKEDWLKLIDRIRKIYHGPLVYNTNHDHEDTAEWFDSLDYIGTSAYYPVGINGHSKEQMIEEWTKIKWRLDAIAESRGKKFIFMEIGCRSAENCSEYPWDFTTITPHNEEEQALFYETCMKVFMEDPNFAGVFWWEWPTVLYDISAAKDDNGFSVYGKKAEEIIKNIYNKYN